MHFNYLQIFSFMKNNHPTRFLDVWYGNRYFIIDHSVNLSNLINAQKENFTQEVKHELEILRS